MGDDRINLATRERVISTDFNNAQSMLSRRADDLQRYFLRDYRVPAPELGSTAPVYQNVVSGLELNFVDATTIQIQPGILALESPSNLTPGILDSPYRVGVLRAATTVSVPDVATDRYLIAARIVEVQVTEENRDVRSPSTDTFTTNAVPKQIELQVEVQVFTLGTQTYPSFDALGTEFEPLGFVLGSVLEDCRNEVRDIVQTAPLAPSGVAIEQAESPLWIERKIQSAQPLDSSNLNSGITGRMTAKHRGRIYRIWSNETTSGGNINPLTNDGEVLVTNQFVHTYLVPIIDATSGKRRVLTNTNNTAAYTQGLLIQSATVGPNLNGTNSAALAIPGNFASNYAVVPAGEAVHVVSATFRGTAGIYRPWVVNGDEFLYAAPGAGVLGTDLWSPNYGTYNTVGGNQAILNNVNFYASAAGVAATGAGIPRNATAFALNVNGSFTGDYEFIKMQLQTNAGSNSVIYEGPPMSVALSFGGYFTGMIPAPIRPQADPYEYMSDVSTRVLFNGVGNYNSELFLTGYRF